MFNRCRSSFNGKIYEIPGIFVDNFENPSTDGARAYFLSHFHTDHTVGLDRAVLREKLCKQKSVFIYATKMTAAIIVYNNVKLEDYVKVLKLGSNLITLPGDPELDLSETILNVTLIPAGHCLGSTMFLFETISVKVLYTGDFRIRSNDLSKYATLHDKNGEVIKLDTLYVDTTFLNRNESFPKRSESVEEAVMLIKRFLDSNEDQHVILDTSANYGYEYVFNQIYKSLQMKVFVDDRKWCFYSTIQSSVPGVTNNADETRIFLKHIPESRESHLPLKIIRFSAYRWDNWNEEEASIEENGNYAYVCFPTHCSRVELISFVEYLKPGKVVGFREPYIVKESPLKEADKQNFVLTPRQSPKKLPSPRDSPIQKKKKVDDAILRKLFG